MARTAATTEVFEEAPTHRIVLSGRPSLVAADSQARSQSVQLAFHPRLAHLAVATTTTVSELDAVAGCSRNAGDSPGMPLRLMYTPDGGTLILLTKEQAIYSWTIATWRRRQLLAPDPKHAGKQLAAGLLAVSGGQQPIIYWTPLGKNTVRMVQTAQPPAAAKGAKLDREFLPGVKLKTENKKPIVGLAVHPYDRHAVLTLLSDGHLALSQVAGAAMTTLASLPVPMSATTERVGLHAWAHPYLPGGALVVVEAQSTGLTVVELAPRQEPRLLTTMRPGPGSAFCGVCLLERGALLAAASRHASGNVQVQAWQLLGDSREVRLQPTSVAPPTVWDALQSSVGKATLADTSGNNLVARAHFQPRTGLLALATVLRGRDGEAGHARVPLLQLLDEGSEAASVPAGVPMHTGLGFWTPRDADGMVSKLRFPRYVHVISGGKLVQHDLTHNLLSDLMALPPSNAAGQERCLAKVVRSNSQGAWLVFMKVLSRQTDRGGLQPGQLEFSLVRDADAALTAGQWFVPGADGAFVGGRHELVAVLSNNGRSVAVYETAKLQAGAKPLYAADVKEGPLLALFPGPPAHIPGPPTPPPERRGRVAAGADGTAAAEDESDSEDDDAAQQAWEQQEAKRLELPRTLMMRTAGNKLLLVEVSPSAVTYSGQSRVLAAKHSLQLRPSEAVLQVAWQALNERGSGFHSGSQGAASACAAVAAVLTNERVLLLSEKLAVVTAASIPLELGVPVSCLWMGPALLVSTAGGQVVQACWDGKLVHLCSLLTGRGSGALGLLGALADRLLVCSKAEAGPGGAPAGSERAEVSGRGLSVLQPMLLGWASLAARRILPGGADRVRQELRALVGSYDASQLSASALERLAAAGFSDVAAAVAARSDSPAITAAHRAVFSAAAGDWGALVGLALRDWEDSAFHPKPPPRGSALQQRMVAVARACLEYGRFNDARRLFEAAGAWNELLALCVFQGDFMGLQAYARQAGRDVERLAEQLMAVNEDAFRRVGGSGGLGGTAAAKALYSGRPNTDDWMVSAAAPAAAAAALSADEGSVGGEEEAGEGSGGGMQAEEAEDVEVAPAGRLPFMEACLQVSSTERQQPAGAGEEEGQPIPSLDLGTLEAYVGVAGATVVKPSVGTPTAAAAPAASAAGGLARMDTAVSDFSAAQEDAAAAKAASGWDSDREGASSASGSGRPAAAARAMPAKSRETAAQEAARAAFRRDTHDEDDFFSSDEEESAGPHTDADNRSLASYGTATSTQQRFRIAIKSPGEESARSGGADTSALRAAAQSLRLGGLLGRSGSFGTGSLDSTPQTSARLGSQGSSGPLAGEPAKKLGSSGGLRLEPQVSSDDPFASMLQSSASSRSNPPAALADDPFAALASLHTPGFAASAAPPPAPPVAPPGPPGPGAPMRAPAPAQPQSNLMAGWADFEALFAAPAASAPAASSSAPASAQPAPPAAPAAGAAPSPAPANAETVACPVCGKTWPASSISNAALNMHIDECLNANVVA